MGITKKGRSLGEDNSGFVCLMGLYLLFETGTDERLMRNGLFESSISLDTLSIWKYILLDSVLWFSDCSDLI